VHWLRWYTSHGSNREEGQAKWQDARNINQVLKELPLLLFQGVAIETI
jgi:hypothetical protein